LRDGFDTEVLLFRGSFSVTRTICQTSREARKSQIIDPDTISKPFTEWAK
jgi:hypothetical protein